MRSSSVLVAAAISCVVMLGSSSARSTALGRDVGGGQVRIVGSVMPALSAYDDAGRSVPPPALVQSAITADIELGVARDLTLRANLPWSYATLDDVATVGVGEVTLGGQLRLLSAYDDDIAVATRLDVKLPLTDNKPATRGVLADGTAAISDGQVDVTALMMLGGRLPMSGYLDIEAGYRMRAGDVTDALVGGLSIGARFFDRMVLAAIRAETVYSLDPPTDRPETVGRGYASIGPWVAVRVFDALHVEAGANFVGRGRNSVGGIEGMLGLWLPF